MFIKIHIPWDTLCKYAERLNIRMPFRYFQILLHSISMYLKDYSVLCKTLEKQMLINSSTELFLPNVRISWRLFFSLLICLPNVIKFMVPWMFYNVSRWTGLEGGKNGCFQSLTSCFQDQSQFLFHMGGSHCFSGRQDVYVASICKQRECFSWSSS